MGIKSRTNSQGQEELYDEDTGEIIAVGKRRERDRAGSRMSNSHRKGAEKSFIKVRNADGKVCLVPKGTDPSNLPASTTKYIYNEVTKDLIIQEIVKGSTLKKISKLEGMPPIDVVYTWRAKYPDFEAAIRQARKFRAEYRHDEVLEIAEQTSKETNIEDRLKVEVYKWSASVDDPDTYGARVKHSGDAQNPVQWVIQTGVPQPKTIEAESTPVENKDERGD